MAILMAAALPMLIVAVPSASDYPNHLARHHIFAAIGQGSAIDRWFAVDWRWVGNLGVDLPVLALTPLIGVELATRLVSALIAPICALGILSLSRAVHGRVTGSAMLALPFVFAQPFLFGFLNYCLSVGLALIVAAAWISKGRPSGWRLIGFAIAALLIWTAHIMGWAVLLLLIGGAELAATRSLGDLGARVLRATPLLAPLGPLLWQMGGGAGPLFWYDPHLLQSKVMNIVTMLKGLYMPFDLGMAAIIGLLAILALLWAGGRRLEPRLAAGGLLLIIAALLLPTTMLGSWGADLRLTPVAAMVAIMAIRPAADPGRERVLMAIGLSLFLLRAGWTSVQWWHGDRVFAERLPLLDKVPRGSRMGFVAVARDCHSGWVLRPDRKLGAYAITRRDAFTNTLFQVPGADLMTLRQPQDRASWLDTSQDIAALCPAGEANLPLLQDRVAHMRKDGFATIWIAGLPAQALPAMAGYRISYARGDDILLSKRR